jgi:ligand-binding sensor domain-containing protein
MKKVSILIFLFLLPFTSSFPFFKSVQGIEDAQIKRVAISSLEPSLVYVASNNSLYKSNDGGKTFNKVSVFKDETVKHIFFDPYLTRTLYIATTRHLYRLKEQLEKLFSSPEEETINTAAKYKGIIYVGMSEGVRFASEDILNWNKFKKIEEASVYYIEPAKEKLYVATSRGVYIIKEGIVERTFAIRESEEEEALKLVANIIKVDIFDGRRVWLGTTQGLFISQDSGESWRKLYSQGIDTLSILSIAQTNLEKDTLYLGTLKGFFKVNFKTKKSKHIFEGLYSPHINWVDFSPSGIIYLATAKGLFKSDYFNLASQRESLKKLLDKEPSIREIQEAVLDYNEVHPDKIRKWREALKYRALFPTFSLDYDKTINYDSGSDKYYVGPRDWGFSFSWDIGDLVWDIHEDDIDTRSRLNTQLRLDILDEINRVYFERLRLKNEILHSSSSDEELFKKQLRLRELTAILDGYSGGYYSKRARELNEK